MYGLMPHIVLVNLAISMPVIAPMKYSHSDGKLDTWCTLQAR